MKKQILTLVGALILTSGMAQKIKENFGATPEDQSECKKNLSIYGSMFNNKQYGEALAPWYAAVENCPEFHPRLYKNGGVIFKKLADKAKKEGNKERKNELIDSLFWTYEESIRIFGESVKVSDKYGKDLRMKYRSKTEFEKAEYGLLKFSITAKKEKSSRGTIAKYYSAAYLMYKADKIEKSSLLDDYILLSDYISVNIEKGIKVESFNKVQASLDGKFLQVADCEGIEGIVVEKVTAALPENKLKLAEKYMPILKKKSCTKSDVYRELAEEMHKANPSHKTAFNLGIMFLNDKKYSEAKKFINEAIEISPEDEPKKKDYFYFLATLYQRNGSYKVAVNNAKKSLGGENDKNAFDLIARCIAATAKSCGDNEYEHKAVYWLAADYALKGGHSSLAKTYLAQAPGKTLLFQYGKLETSKEKIKCWGESTAIRK